MLFSAKSWQFCRLMFSKKRCWRDAFAWQIWQRPSPYVRVHHVFGKTFVSVTSLCNAFFKKTSAVFTLRVFLLNINYRKSLTNYSIKFVNKLCRICGNSCSKPCGAHIKTCGSYFSCCYALELCHNHPSTFAENPLHRCRLSRAKIGFSLVVAAKVSGIVSKSSPDFRKNTWDFCQNTRPFACLRESRWQMFSKTLGEMRARVRRVHMENAFFVYNLYTLFG